MVKVYQLLAHGRWFSLGTPASSTTKTGCHDIAEILLKVALNTINQIKYIYIYIVHLLQDHMLKIFPQIILDFTLISKMHRRDDVRCRQMTSDVVR